VSPGPFQRLAATLGRDGDLCMSAQASFAAG